MGSTTVVNAFIGILGAVLYFLPAAIASDRRVKDRKRILLLNVLLGWTVVAWFAALVWAVSAPRGDRNPAHARIHEPTPAAAILGAETAAEGEQLPVDTPPATAPRSRPYWRSWRQTWSFTFLGSLAVLAVGGAVVASSQTPFGFPSGAVDGVISCLVWATLINFGVAAAWSLVREPVRPGWRLAIRGFLATAVVVTVIGGGLGFLRASNGKAARQVTAAQIAKAQSYLTSHYPCTEPPTALGSGVACRTGPGAGVALVVTPRRDVDPVAYDKAIAEMRDIYAGKAILATTSRVDGWDGDYELTVAILRQQTS